MTFLFYKANSKSRDHLSRLKCCLFWIWFACVLNHAVIFTSDQSFQICSGTKYLSSHLFVLNLSVLSDMFVWRSVRGFPSVFPKHAGRQWLTFLSEAWSSYNILLYSPFYLSAETDQIHSIGLLYKPRSTHFIASLLCPISWILRSFVHRPPLSWLTHAFGFVWSFQLIEFHAGPHFLLPWLMWPVSSQRGAGGSVYLLSTQGWSLWEIQCRLCAQEGLCYICPGPYHLATATFCSPLSKSATWSTACKRTLHVDSRLCRAQMLRQTLIY